MSASGMMESIDAGSSKRRIMAVLMTDVYRFTQRVNIGEESVVERLQSDLRRMAEVCEQHGGKIVANRGDGLKVIFESSVEAATAAVELQRELRKKNEERPAESPSIVHRMGVHVGDVVLTQDPVTGLLNVSGAAVTVAARLEQRCPPGQVAFVEDVANDIKRNLNRVPLGFLAAESLKDVPGTTRIWTTKFGGEVSEMPGDPMNPIMAAHRRERAEINSFIEEMRGEIAEMKRNTTIISVLWIVLLAIAGYQIFALTQRVGDLEHPTSDRFAGAPSAAVQPDSGMAASSERDSSGQKGNKVRQEPRSKSGKADRSQDQPQVSENSGEDVRRYRRQYREDAKTEDTPPETPPNESTPAPPEPDSDPMKSTNQGL
ncbi:MAG: adenylate/guanylate cyclase domain-containing protein [Armatimonadetes bacterium]|nr:adenylate/guanylate cyclase domain-containing protein [Armatimonadota bacterium]